MAAVGRRGTRERAENPTSCRQQVVDRDTGQCFEHV